MRNLLLLIIFSFSFNLFTHDYKEIKVGISENYAPYQYIERNKVGGIDAELITLILDTMNEEFSFIHDDWNNIIARYKFNNNITIITGMEITEFRKRFTLFTEPLYFRQSAIFVKKGSIISNISSLKGRVVTSDRDSSTEKSLKQMGLLSTYRLKNTHSKRDSMQLLAEGIADAVIMPLMVGYYFANEFNIEVDIIYIDDNSTPVGIAVKEEHKNLLNSLNQTINQLKESGDIDTILNRWRLNQQGY